MERPINPDMLGGSLKNILASLSLSCVMESIQSKTQPAAQGKIWFNYTKSITTIFLYIKLYLFCL